MVAQLVSLSLMSALFLGEATGEWCYAEIYHEDGPTVDGGDDSTVRA
jgi:hypothetical protein